MPRALLTLVCAALAFILAGCGRADYSSAKTASAPAAGFSESREATRDAAESARPPALEAKSERAEHVPLPPSVSANGQFRSGTLTAGSLDDQAKFAEFSTYLANAMQYDRHQELPRFAIGRRAVIRVINEQGQSIAGANVAISANDNVALAAGGRGIATNDNAVRWTMNTGADGQVVFLSGLDAPLSGSEFVLTVTPADGGQPVSQRVSLDQTPWTITLAQSRQVLPRQLDLALVIDTTGSMGDELNYLKVEFDHIAAEVHERFPNVDQRYGLVLYRDQGDAYVTRTFDFTGSPADFRQKLAAQSAEGGGDYPEAMHVALEQCTQLPWRGAGTARVAFLVADAPPHSQFAQRTLDTANKLRRAGVTVFPVASSGVREQAEFIMRAIGFLTQGKYLFLTDHSGVGNPHAKPQAPSYAVEKLDQLMIRMIADKLSGQTGLPQDVIAIEEPGQQESGQKEPGQSADLQPVVMPQFPAVVVPVQQSAESTAATTSLTTRFDWWGLTQTLLVLAVVSLLLAIEKLLAL